MFCLRCGKEIDDNAMKCPFCNCPTENAGTIDVDTIDPPDKSAESMGIASIVLAAFGMVFALLFALIGWICAGAGITISLIGRNKSKNNHKCNTGLVMSVIALGFSFISSLIGMAMMM